MARQPVLVVLAVIVVALLALVFAVTTQLSTNYTNKVSCVDSVVVYAASTFTNGSQALVSETTVTSFTTTTSVSATAGHVTTENFSGHVFLSGEATTQRKCTFMK